MSEALALYSNDGAMFSGAPEPLRPAIQYIASHRESEASQSLLHFIASLVEPGHTCSLAPLQQLPIDARTASVVAFEYCLGHGLSAEERVAVLGWLRPELDRLNLR